MEEVVPFEFEYIAQWTLSSLSSKESEPMILQWNLDKCLTWKKFRYIGPSTIYDKIVKDFFRDSNVRATLSISGAPDIPLNIDLEELNTHVLSTDFFDILETKDIVTPSGSIRGCVDEIFDGITVGDQLRELLVNGESERADVFSTDDRREVIFKIFKLFCVGGTMCQPDNKVSRYIDLTKALYKELLTVYKDGAGAIKVASKVFEVRCVAGLNIFAHPDSPHNMMLLVVDNVKKHVLVLKYEYQPFW